MLPLAKPVVKFLTSLRVTVVLLAFSLALVFFATWAQKDLGIWVVQQKYFRSLFVMARIPGTDLAVPIFPGGYLLGGLLLLNLTAAHAYRFRLGWRKSGIWLAHVGLILLLLGELFTGLWQREGFMRLDPGAPRNYAESSLKTELAIVDTTNPDYDDVVAIPEGALEKLSTLQMPKLPFTVRTTLFYPNAALAMRNQAPNAAPSPADQGFGPQFVVMPQPITYREDEQNSPTAFVELTGAEGRIGTWLISTLLTEAQTFSYAGRSWSLQLRPVRYYQPFSLTLLKFTHDVYPGTDIPKNFSSRVRVQTPDGHVDRETLIYMNNPLRYGGLTFYQSGYQNERTSILQVVRNPSWVLPYVSCVMIFVGLAIQFMIHLVGFFRKRAAATAAAS